MITKEEALQKFSFLSEIDKTLMRRLMAELAKCLISDDKSFIEAMAAVSMA